MQTLSWKKHLALLTVVSKPLARIPDSNNTTSGNSPAKQREETAMRELNSAELEQVFGGQAQCPPNLPSEVTINGKRYKVSCSVGEDGRVRTRLTPIED